jgi:hypothetical protein
VSAGRRSGRRNLRLRVLGEAGLGFDSSAAALGMAPGQAWG